MKSRILSHIAAILLGLLVYHTSSAHEKSQRKKSHGHGHWMAPPEAARRPNPIARDEASIERRTKLFQAHCVACHGTQGKGDGPAAAALKPKPPNLALMAGHHPDGDLAWKISNGRGAMPGWQGVLSENDIWDLTNFIKSLSHEKHSR